MLIHNIANNRDKGGYFYSSEGYHPNSNHLPVEPWLGGSQLLFDEKREFPDTLYFSHTAYLEALKEHRIIDFLRPAIPEKLVEVIEKREKATHKIIEIDEPTAFATEEKSELEEFTEIAKAVDEVANDLVEEAEKSNLTPQELLELRPEDVSKSKKKGKK
jgi:hypothetical protein